MSASQTTMDKLYGMRLSVMAQAYRDQEEMLGVADMTFDERFAMIVDAEWDSRRINKRTRLLRQAAFSDPEANVIDIRYDADRKLDKVKIAGLANCEWVKAHRNVLIATRACPRCSTSSPYPRTRNGSNRRSATRSAMC